MAAKQKLARGMPIGDIGISHSLLEEIIVDDLRQVRRGGKGRVKNDCLSHVCKELAEARGKKEVGGFFGIHRHEYVHSFDGGKAVLCISTDMLRNCPERPIIPDSVITLYALDGGRFNELAIKYGQKIPISEYMQVALRSPGGMEDVGEKNPVLVHPYLVRLFGEDGISRAAKSALASALESLKGETQAALVKSRRLIRAIDRGIAKSVAASGLEILKEETNAAIGNAQKLIRIVDDGIGFFAAKGRTRK